MNPLLLFEQIWPSEIGPTLCNSHNPTTAKQLQNDCRIVISNHPKAFPTVARRNWLGASCAKNTGERAGPGWLQAVFLSFQTSKIFTRGVEVERKIRMGTNLAIERAIAALDAVRAIAHKSIFAGAAERPGVGIWV